MFHSKHILINLKQENKQRFQIHFNKHANKIYFNHAQEWDLPRPSTAPGLGVCEWSPEGLYDKSVSWIPNTDEIL